FAHRFVDNCPFTPNSNQHDLDCDGAGSACDPDESDRTACGGTNWGW
ncbi:MAG: hypothetical protein HY466_05210, partial [Deltaproteobacteria bacterium]|nr:hypothetical protein [Deltaproteobacteria bacterium]